METNIRIVTKYGELYYKSVEDLNILFNRIVDDFTDVENRYGEFSYDFFLPNIKQNASIFDYVIQHGRKKVFRKNQDIPCKVYNNNELILNGIISLIGISEEGYRCKFNSNFTALIDILQEKKLNELTFPLIEWNYEETIIDHILANYADADETIYQFPLSFYSTKYAEEDLYKTPDISDSEGILFRTDNARQNFYYFLNSLTTNKFNRTFYHEMPPAVYLVSIVKQIIEEAGYSLGGQFFEQDNIKKIIYVYAGEDDIYDKATGVYSGSTTLQLQLGKFLPDLRQSDFIQSIINMFNLYMIVEGNVVKFETYKNLFGDVSNPYDLTDKIDEKTIEFEYAYYNPSITFEVSNNEEVLGDSKVMSGNTETFVKNDNIYFNETFNYVGDEGNLRIRFAEPNISVKRLWNDYDISGNTTSSGATNIYLPMLSKQTIYNNEGKPFNKNAEDNYLFNNESSITFRGTGTLMYYYGISTNPHHYINIYTGTTINRIPIPIVSPFQFKAFRDDISDVITGMTVSTINTKEAVVASYLKSLEIMLGGDISKETDYSLVFDDTYLHDTLYTTYHQRKYDRYMNSEMLTADVRLTPYDWQQLQINRPVRYNKELYHIVSIESYDIVNQVGIIKLIKVL